jgi:hypothetical protein
MSGISLAPLLEELLKLAQAVLHVVQRESKGVAAWVALNGLY